MSSYFTQFATPQTQKAYLSGLGIQPQTQSDLLKELMAKSSGVGGVGGGSYKLPEPPKPQVPTLSLDQMMDIINRRVGLMVDPQIEGLRRGLEEERVAHQARVGDVKAGYEDARAQLQKMGEANLRQGATTMRKRGLYESPMAVDLANRIQRQTAEHGLKLEDEQARILADLAEYLATRERATTEEIQALEGRRGEWAQSLLDEMEQRERDRRDRLEQQAFENWLAQEAMKHQVWQANRPSRGASSASTQVGYKDILEQLQMAALMSMPQQQQFAYSLFGPDYLLQQMGGGQPRTFDELMDQELMRYYRGLPRDEQLAYLKDPLNRR
ncbi:MAG: hypothetical protein GX483_08950 [Actinomycetaceae bacterium]|nr:hypothetical protein [Actinomycetaceae bacterium]